MRGQTTRLDLAPEALARLRQGLTAFDERQALDAAPQAAARPNALGAVQGAPSVAPPAATPTSLFPDAVADVMPGSGAPVSSEAPPISIHVDLSNWELDKIEAFLRLIGYLPPRDT